MGNKNHPGSPVTEVPDCGEGRLQAVVFRHFTIFEWNVEIHPDQDPSALYFYVPYRLFQHSAHPFALEVQGSKFEVYGSQF
jgi:hypothetical protein